MKLIIKNTLILLAITLVSGLLLAGVHDITAEPIKVAEENAKAAAFETVFPDADGFSDCKTDISAYVPENSVELGELQNALDKDGNIIGWVMTLTSPKGYGGDIKIAVGITKDGSLTGMTVISMGETPGLGAKCTGRDFQSQFAGITAKNITSTKTGKSTDNEIDAISGATFTTTAIVQAVNAGLELAYDYLMNGGAA